MGAADLAGDDRAAGDIPDVFAEADIEIGLAEDDGDEAGRRGARPPVGKA